VSSVTSRGAVFIVLSGVSGGASRVLYFLALQRGEATPVALIDKSSLLFLIALSVIILREHLLVF